MTDRQRQAVRKTISDKTRTHTRVAGHALRIVIYLRISRDRDGTFLAPDRQLQDCQGVATALGGRVVAVLTDDDIGAYAGKRRPAYEELLQLMRDGEVDIVIAWHTDRLHRSPRELEDFIDICEARKPGIAVHTAQSGPIDLSTPSGRAVARTLGAWARFESEHKSERIKRQREQLADLGKFSGGRRPFGYDDGGIKVRPREARAVQRAAKIVLAGGSLGDVVRDMEKHGIKTSTGADWTRVTVKQMLLRPRNAGIREHHGKEVGPAAWKPILTEDTYRAVKAKLTDPQRRMKPEHSTRKWLLTGIGRCGLCGATLACAPVNNGADGAPRAVYRCSVKSHIGRNAYMVEKLVELVLLKRLSRPDALELLREPSDEEQSALFQESTVLRARLKDIAEEFGGGGMTRQQFRAANTKAQERLDAVELRLAQLARVPDVSDLLGREDIEQKWAELSLARKRALVSTLMIVKIKPIGRATGCKFVRDGIEISFKHDLYSEEEAAAASAG